MGKMNNEKGSVLVFVTLIIVVLLIMVGMGLDTGQLAYVRSQGQAAVDAAALSAVSGLPSLNETQVVNRAAAFNTTNDYVASLTNQIGSANVSYVKYNFSTNTIDEYVSSIQPGVNGVRVALENTTSTAINTPVFLTPLMNLLGLSVPADQNVNVSAVAVIRARPAIPIALWNKVCDEANPVQIKFQHPTPDNGWENACWTTFRDCSSGAQDIKAAFRVGERCSGGNIDGKIDLETPICQNRGQVQTVVFTAEQFFDDHSNIPCWIVPVIAGGGNCDPNNPTPITDFAKLCPISIFKQGANSYITANVTCNQSLNRLDSSLCFDHRLVRETDFGM